MTQTYDLTDDTNSYKFRATDHDIQTYAQDALRLITAIRLNDENSIDLESYEHYDIAADENSDDATGMLRFRLNQLATICEQCIGRHNYQSAKLRTAKSAIENDEYSRAKTRIEEGIYGFTDRTGDKDESDDSDTSHIKDMIERERQLVREQGQDHDTIMKR